MSFASERGRRLDRLTRLLDPERRLVDVAFRFRIWRCICGFPHRPQSAEPKAVDEYLKQMRSVKHRAEPADLLPRVYGAKYDAMLRRYVDEADKVIEIPCHEGQVELLSFADPAVTHIIAIGTQGAGKTQCVAMRGLVESVLRPNSFGGLVAPTNERRKIVWRKFLNLVQPLGWVLSVSVTNKEIELINSHVVQIIAAKAPSTQHGSPIQGRDWWWSGVDESQNVDEEAHQEILARGRVAGEAYKVFETATNADIGSFKVKKKEAEQNPRVAVLKMFGDQNAFIDPFWYWERMRDSMTEREFRRLVLLEDVPPELLVYPEFEYKRHVTDVPKGAKDITQELVYQHFRREGIRWIAAQDFGVLTSCTEMLKCYEVMELDPSGKGQRVKRMWFAHDEITSGSDVTADIHARRILERYEADQVLVIADPHFNTKDSDKADYSLVQREGLQIIPAVHGKVKREHRYAMVNLLLRDGHLFIQRGRCRKLIESFMSLQRNEFGEAERDRKDRHDMSHWTAALGYGLFPFEKIRGGGTLRKL